MAEDATSCKLAPWFPLQGLHRELHHSLPIPEQWGRPSQWLSKDGRLGFKTLQLVLLQAGITQMLQHGLFVYGNNGSTGSKRKDRRLSLSPSADVCVFYCKNAQFY